MFDNFANVWTIVGLADDVIGCTLQRNANFRYMLKPAGKMRSAWHQERRMEQAGLPRIARFE